VEQRNFRKLLEAQWAKGNFVCVGLDSEYSKIPYEAHRTGGIHSSRLHQYTLIEFNEHIVDSTHDLVCAYKPNIAFYENWGDEGWLVLKHTIRFINRVAPGVPVILDAKCADTGNTNVGYVQMAFEFLQADAITVNPYLGQEALKPFLDRADKGIIVLCRTSNSDVSIQNLTVIPTWGDERRWGLGSGPRGESEPTHMPLYEYIAHTVVNDWNTNNNCVLIVGATCSQELRDVRKIVGNMPILIPAVGFQQKGLPLEKQVKQVVSAGKDSRCKGMIINSSREIIFASKEADFAEAARRETEKLRDLINQYR